MDGKDRMMGECTPSWTGAYACGDAGGVGRGRMRIRMRRRMRMGVYVYVCVFVCGGGCGWGCISRCVCARCGVMAGTDLRMCAVVPTCSTHKCKYVIRGGWW